MKYDNNLIEKIENSKTVAGRSSKPEKEPKQKKPVKLEDRYSYKFKKWFFGVGKEFKRITWIGKHSVFQDFITVIVIISILCVIFLAIDTIYLKITSSDPQLLKITFLDTIYLKITS